MIKNIKFNINKKLLIIKQKSKKSKKLALLFIVILIILSTFLIFNLTDYLPFLSEIKQPAGNIESINIQKYIEENPKIGEMPNLDKIKYNIWKSDLTIEQVVNSYKQDLLKEGYDLQYDNTINYNGKEYYVLGFIKGLTAVGILISLDTTFGDHYKSEIIYATGNVIDFNEIIDWYQTQ
jgi:hypothetical protein